MLPVCLPAALAVKYGAMAPLLEQIDWCDVPLLPAIVDQAWEREAARRFGFPSNLAKFLTPVHWLMEAEQLVEARVTPSISVPLRAFISMAVAMDSSCRHCYGAFRSMLKILGYPEGVIRELEESLAVDELTNKEQAALEFARKVSRSAPRPDASDLRELRTAGFSQLEIAEIAYLAAINAAANRLATLLAVPPDPLEEIDANWFERLKRPFTRKEFRAALSTVANVPYPAGFVGPGAEIVRALEGSPAGAALATILQGAWKSTITSKRIKALIFAVIARGLGCPACEAEAAKDLRDEGWTDPEIQHVLRHLTSTKLDSFERKVLSFARETVRYQTRRLQELAQTFAKGLKREVLLEIVGLVSYANGLARMSILLRRG
jgi:alkylhydroperoxidase family enzyme